ncbi:diguanylate cyclase (GGDEF) domain protein [Leptospira fainei serovar Hurstbridge str. BUT 6]|uniref:diguanylate cyclase n=2 Tax=Leptospira fainei TaxID=48782 RepID=S3UVY1_9LEPT|nr:diguanylate cyclase (GGDEF) domain protein [Leptospira fainei serovar Hurstbridge str. BUT 6]
MSKQKSNFAVITFLRALRIHTDEADLSKLIYICMLLVVSFITFLSATISWIQFPKLFLSVVILYSFSGLSVLLILLSQKKNTYFAFGFNLFVIVLLAYLYFPSGGSFGATPFFILINALFSWILLFGGSSKKLVVSMLLHASFFIVNPIIDIFDPHLVSNRYPDRISQIHNLMLWGIVSIVFIMSCMWLWSGLLQNRFHNLISQIEIDDLTGTYRKSFMMAVIENFRTSSALFQRTHSIAFVDLDKFKQINDTYGHLIGDEVLVDLIQCCRTFLRKTDYISRYGGDEFLLFFPDTNVEEAFAIMERLRIAVAENNWSTKSINVTISVGVGELLMDREVRYSLELIDEKMYESKRTGKNKVVSVANER